MKLRLIINLSTILIMLSPDSTGASVANEQKKSLTITDIMRFNSIDSSQISNNGLWIAYAAKPDRGDSTGYVKNTKNDTFYQIKHGTKPSFSDNNQFVAFTQPPSLLEKEKSSAQERKKLPSQIVIINLDDGKKLTYSNVKSYQFSGHSSYIAISVKAPTNNKKHPKESNQEKLTKKTLYNKKPYSKDLILVNLQTGHERRIDNVKSFSFSAQSALLAYAVSTKDAQDNRLEIIDLTSNKTTVIIKDYALSIAQLAWSKSSNKLGIVSGNYQQETKTRPHKLSVWQPSEGLVSAAQPTSQWFLSHKHSLQWGVNDKRLFFGYSPLVIKDRKELEPASIAETDLFNIEKILAKKEMQTWHANDPKIKTHAAVDYKKDSDSFYLASFDVNRKRVAMLASDALKTVTVSENAFAFIGYDHKPYRKQQTWNGRYFDAYRVDLKTAKKQLIAKNLQNARAIKVSENGRYITYIKDGHLWAFDSKKSQHKNLSIALNQQFVDQDNDRPEPAKAYGIHGWISGTDKFLAYDKYDLWLFDYSSAQSTNLTKGHGRLHKRAFRIVQTEPKQAFVTQKQTLLLSSFNTQSKQHGFFEYDLEKNKLGKLVESDKRYRFVAKAQDNENYLYTREDYNEFPDLWLANGTFSQTKKMSKLGDQTKPFLWGNSKLISWQNNDGKPTQGRLILPENFSPDKRYPVLVYFYENYSDRLNDFSPMKINHRPNLPYYTSNGYVVFQPDVHQVIGQPGDAIVKSIVPGVQKLIALGIAAPDAIGLHGHSWGGYGTAYTITKTDLFAAAVAGAPVSNMTSAYAGIRLKSGMARQFQYETGQSRLGANLWQQRHLYIDNSPLFFADRINTPLLIQFGDVDDAVPWQQGVELYMAMRRLDKNAVMLQYEGEPHHLKKYPNKLDYTIKVKQYFDHFLTGKPAPSWLTNGEGYRPQR